MNRMSTLWKGALVLSAVLALGSIGTASWFGYLWYNAAQGGSASVVDARDGAIEATRKLAATLQTLDATRPEEGLDNWAAVATGALSDQLRQDRAKYLDHLKKSPISSSATVLDVALTELDASAGTATAIVAMDVTQSVLVHNRPSLPAVRQLRVKLNLSETGEGWKVAGTSLIPADSGAS